METRPNPPEATPGPLDHFPDEMLTLLRQAMDEEERYQDEGDAGALDRSIEIRGRILDDPVLATLEQGLRLDATFDVAGAYLKRHEAANKVADLIRAIKLYEQVASEVSPDAENRAMYLAGLSNAIAHRYRLGGRPADLGRSIELSKQALECSPPDSELLPSLWNDLATGLRNRYLEAGDLNDLNRCIDILEVVLPLSEPGSDRETYLLDTLANALADRGRRNEDFDDAKRAVATFYQIIERLPPGNARLPELMNSLGGCLGECYQLSKDPVFLEVANELLSELEDDLAEDSTFLPGIYQTLGSILRDLERAQAGPGYEGEVDPELLDEAISVWEMAESLIPQDSVDGPSAADALARGLMARFERDGAEKDRDRAIGLFELAARGGLVASIEVALSAAKDWGQWAFRREEWAEAARAYSYVASARERLAMAQTFDRHARVWARQGQNTPGWAAFALAKTGDSKAAIVAFEVGLASFLADVLERDQADLHGLGSGHEILIRRFQEARAWVSRYRGTIPGAGPGLPGLNLSDAAAARAELVAAIEAIRRVPGQESFLARPGWAEVQAILADLGPTTAVVYLVTNIPGSLALIATSDAVESLWLDYDLRTLLDFLVKAEDGVCVGGYLAGQETRDSKVAEESRWFADSLTEGLPILGRVLMGPIAARLRVLGVSNVVLITSSTLGLLPLHAACYETAGGEVGFLDEFAVSHAPNLRTYAAARRSLAGRAGLPPHLVAVGNPLPSPSPLPWAEAEAGSVATQFAEGARHLFTGLSAGRQAVLGAMAGATHLHFACHGRFDFDRPLDSRLVLSHRGTITLADFLDGPARAPLARLAVLSACETGKREFAREPDEFLGLPAGLLQAGVPGVVASLWPVDDRATMLLMVRFYELHLHGDPPAGLGPMPPIEALRRAQSWLRGATAGILADRFRAEMQLDESRGGLDPKRSRDLWLDFSALERDDRPYQDPVFWAAFALTGL